MPLDSFDDRSAARRRERAARPGLRSQTVSAFQALLGDVAYFWWAFAGLGAVMWVATVC